MEPEPLVIFQGYGESSIDFLFAVWTTRENFLPLRNSLSEEIKRLFDAEGIEIPFPHRTLYVGSETGPLTVHVIGTLPPERDPTLPGERAADAVD
jgi:small-conductance mechanosensitive channel